MFSETKTCPRHGKISYMLWYKKARVLLWEIISSLDNRAAIPPKTTMKQVLLSGRAAVPLPALSSSWTQTCRQVCSSRPPSAQELGHVHSAGIGLGDNYTHCRAEDAGDTRTCPTAFISSNLILQASSMRPGRSSYVTEVLALPLRRHCTPQAARPDTTRRINSYTSFFPQTSTGSQGHNIPHNVFPRSLQ